MSENIKASIEKSDIVNSQQIFSLIKYTKMYGHNFHPQHYLCLNGFVF